LLLRRRRRLCRQRLFCRLGRLGQLSHDAGRAATEGNSLLYGTYLGGAGCDVALELAVDSGNAYVAGTTESIDFPTAFPWQPANGGGRDAFVAKLDQDASDLLFGTYFGGSGDEFDHPFQAYYMGFDYTTGGVYFASATSSTDLPTTPGAYDESFNGGAYDAFVAAVAITVTPVCDYALQLEPLAAAQTGDAGTTVTYTLHVTNSGDCADVLEVAVDALWPTEVPATVGPLAAGEGMDVIVTVAIPAGAGNQDVATVTFTSQGDSAVSAFSVLTTMANVQTYRIYLPMVSKATDDLLVWYDFEGDFLTSGIVADGSGNGQDAQVVGTVGAAGGISDGQAILFSPNGYIQAGGNPAAGRTNVSFSLWFKTDQPGENYKLASAAWWDWGPGSGWIMATHLPEFWSDDTRSLYLPDLPNNDNGFLAGEWNHEVVTYDGDRIREYTNGQLINDWPTTGAPIGQGQAMAVGSWPQFWGYDFYGSLDEFKMFARSLTQEEVLVLYNQGR
jgi:hypothetical protein